MKTYRMKVTVCTERVVNVRADTLCAAEHIALTAQVEAEAKTTTKVSRVQVWQAPQFCTQREFHGHIQATPLLGDLLEPDDIVPLSSEFIPNLSRTFISAKVAGRVGKPCTSHCRAYRPATNLWPSDEDQLQWDADATYDSPLLLLIETLATTPFRRTPGLVFIRITPSLKFVGYDYHGNVVATLPFEDVQGLPYLAVSSLPLLPAVVCVIKREDMTLDQKLQLSRTWRENRNLWLELSTL